MLWAMTEDKFEQHCRSRGIIKPDDILIAKLFVREQKTSKEILHLIEGRYSLPTINDKRKTIKARLGL